MSYPLNFPYININLHYIFKSWFVEMAFLPIDKLYLKIELYPDVFLHLYCKKETSS